MRVSVELYGRLRDAGLGPEVVLEVSSPACAGDVLKALSARLGKEGSHLESCVLASETEILKAGAPLPAGERLAVLPPVCGG